MASLSIHCAGECGWAGLGTRPVPPAPRKPSAARRLDPARTTAVRRRLRFPEPPRPKLFPKSKSHTAKTKTPEALRGKIPKVRAELECAQNETPKKPPKSKGAEIKAQVSQPIAPEKTSKLSIQPESSVKVPKSSMKSMGKAGDLLALLQLSSPLTLTKPAKDKANSGKRRPCQPDASETPARPSAVSAPAPPAPKKPKRAEPSETHSPKTPSKAPIAVPGPWLTIPKWPKSPQVSTPTKPSPAAQLKSILKKAPPVPEASTPQCQKPTLKLPKAPRKALPSLGEVSGLLVGGSSSRLSPATLRAQEEAVAAFLARKEALRSQPPPPFSLASEEEEPELEIVAEQAGEAKGAPDDRPMDDEETVEEPRSGKPVEPPLSLVRLDEEMARAAVQALRPQPPSEEEEEEEDCEVEEVAQPASKNDKVAPKAPSKSLGTLASKAASEQAEDDSAMEEAEEPVGKVEEALKRLLREAGLSREVGPAKGLRCPRKGCEELLEGPAHLDLHLQHQHWHHLCSKCRSEFRSAGSLAAHRRDSEGCGSAEASGRRSSVGRAATEKFRCEPCAKDLAPNSRRAHLLSRKHRDNQSLAH